ncbi:hypothetical protein TSUD_405760 [Trifolium subterraneum]|uniref:Uncharacterized protein n=1 Tax=Trifolium subterraneum TaxID=3900 RepID=A0A2Z6NYP4_TRISU|nr:hypothetical protein TSUD_405760 [Trifolium subterraneum]
MMASYTDITLEEKFVELQKAKKTPENRRPKIQRVAEHIRNREKIKEHYSPRLVSIGPIHHDNTNLKLGEKYKLMWAVKYAENANLVPHNLHKKIADNIDDLKGLFADDVLTLTEKSLKGYRSLDEKLSWILFVDGCSLLYILENADFENPCPMHIKFDQLGIVIMDVLLLENQLPYHVLKLLRKNENEIELINIMKNFHNRCDLWSAPENTRIWRPPIQKKEEEEEEEEQVHSVVILIPNEPDESELPTHLLDLQRTIILTKSSPKTEGNKANKMNQERSEERMMTYRNIQDLRKVGIKLESSATQGPINIHFSEGWFVAKLTLPEIVVDDSTASTFLNLIAYEMCPDFDNDYEICSFISFMDELIDHAEDVRILRLKGVLLNCLGSDEDVAHLFNIISNDLVENRAKYLVVRAKIHERYCNKYKTWIARGIHTYFNNPWTFIAFVAAIIALTLTSIQTWFTIKQSK